MSNEIDSARTRINSITDEIRERSDMQSKARKMGKSASHTAPVKQLTYEKQRLEAVISRAEAMIETLQSGE